MHRSSRALLAFATFSSSNAQEAAHARARGTPSVSRSLASCRPMTRTPPSPPRAPPNPRRGAARDVRLLPHAARSRDQSPGNRRRRARSVHDFVHMGRAAQWMMGFLSISACDSQRGVNHFPAAATTPESDDVGVEQEAVSIVPGCTVTTPTSVISGLRENGDASIPWNVQVDGDFVYFVKTIARRIDEDT